jgi:hypothetical protein
MRKKPLFTFAFVLVSALSARAGCGGVCIFSNQNQNCYAVNDTVYLSQGSTVLYANYNDCCNTLFGGNATLVWCLNGIPFDTTSTGSQVSAGMYSQQLTVGQPGVYTVYFINFVDPSYACGSVTVLERSNELNALPGSDMASVITSVFPNPATDQMMVTSTCPILHVKICSQNGSEMPDVIGNREGTEFNIDVSGYPPGIYFVEVLTARGPRMHKLIRL